MVLFFILVSRYHFQWYFVDQLFKTSICSKTTQGQASQDENRGVLFIKIIIVITRKSNKTFHPIGK